MITLPKEILYIILNYLDDVTLKNVFSTNRYFANVRKNKVFWINRILIKYPYLTNHLKDCDWQAYYRDLVYTDKFNYNDWDYVTSDRSDGHMLLHGAEKGRIDYVLIALHEGTDINHRYVSKYRLYNSSAMSLAAEHGHMNIIGCLVERGANVDIIDEAGMTPLMWAAWDGYIDIVELLLNNGANINSVDSEDGCTALMVAARENQLDVLKLLLNRGADINITNIYEENVLEYVVRMAIDNFNIECYDIIEYLKNIMG